MGILLMAQPLTDAIGTNTAESNEAGEPGHCRVFVRLMDNGYIKPMGGGEWIMVYSESGMRRMLARIDARVLGPVRCIQLPGLAEWRSFRNPTNNIVSSCWTIPARWFYDNQALLKERVEGAAPFSDPEETTVVAEGWRFV